MGNVRCDKCGYGWECKSKLKYVSCPSCRQKVLNTSIENKEEQKKR